MTLDEYAEKLGFNVCYTNVKSGEVNHTRKVIFLPQCHSAKRQHQFCHEIGHCIIAKYLTPKINNITHEVLAWVVGVFVCIKCRENIKGYFSECVRCLKTHLRNNSR
jgi:hypothetical protein